MKFILLSIAVFFSLLLFSMYGGNVAHGANPPIPEKKSEALNKYQNSLEAAKAQEEALQDKIQSLEKEIERTKNKLIDVARSVQKNENAMQDIENEIETLGSERDTLEAQLEKDHARISSLILTLERIRRVPPEALIIKPDAPLKTAQTVMLLQEIIPTINEQTEKYQKDISRLKDLEMQLGEKKEKLVEKSKHLADEEKSLNSLVKKREELFASTQRDFKETQERLKTISKKSKNLKELVSRIGEENERRKNEQIHTAAVSKKAVVQALPDMNDLKSGVQLPVSGAILVGYEQPDRFGAPSAGITIESRSAALVTSPMSGIVRFAGEFKHYGHMVIIEHDDGYHSLIAGLGDINVYVDQPVNVGEPIAKLKKAVNGKKPSLYYELRFKGKAVDPARKFSGLG